MIWSRSLRPVAATGEVGVTGLPRLGLSAVSPTLPPPRRGRVRLTGFKTFAIKAAVSDVMIPMAQSVTCEQVKAKMRPNATRPRTTTRFLPTRSRAGGRHSIPSRDSQSCGARHVLLYWSHGRADSSKLGEILDHAMPQRVGGGNAPQVAVRGKRLTDDETTPSDLRHPRSGTSRPRVE